MSAEDASGSAPAGRVAQVLVVDDQPEIRRLLSVALGGLQVLQAADGPAALQLARAERPRVVLLDVMLPGEMDGLAVLRALRADPRTRHLPVCMLTARGQASDEQLARGLGADGYIRKPFSPRAVRAWVDTQLALAAPPPGGGATAAAQGTALSSPSNAAPGSPSGGALPPPRGGAA